MKTIRYSAHYRCASCGAQRLRIERAASYHDALSVLPRWIYPDGHSMRRESAPKLYEVKQ